MKVIYDTMALREKIELQLLENDPENMGDSFRCKIENFNKQHTEAKDKVAFRKKNGNTLLDILKMNTKLSKSFWNNSGKKRIE
jgi:hypothetical protein